MFNFCPELTPLGISVLSSFILRDRAYVVDVDGALYEIIADHADPDFWCWQEVLRLSALRFASSSL